MTRPIKSAAYTLLVIALSGTTILAQKPSPPQKPFPASSRAAIEDALGRKGAPFPGGVLKFGFPRGDLHVVANGVTLRPAFALGSWVAFERVKDYAIVMGDLVLVEGEVESVMASLQQNGVEQTALHNHLLGESPRVMYMHIHAIGNPTRIARAIRTALEFTGTPLAAPTATPTSPVTPIAPMDLDTAAIAGALGAHGNVNGGVFQVSIPRHEKIKEEKHEIPPSMGISTAINFQSTGAGKAAITGDFVLLGREVNPVLWAMAEGGIQVTAIHSHMLLEEPRLFFMHFWANDDAIKLARALHAALSRTGSKQ
jgi:hypothetical protein